MLRGPGEVVQDARNGRFRKQGCFLYRAPGPHSAGGRAQIRGRTTKRLAKGVAELLAELLGKLGEGEALVLRAEVLDLERAHQRGDATRC